MSAPHRATRPTRALAAVLAVVWLAASLAGCSEDPTPAELAEPSPSPTSTPSVTPSPTGAGPRTPRTPVGRFPRYVALGDSFTAAPLITEPVDTDGCLRSAGNYPALVAESLGSRLQDRSCTGADTRSLTAEQRTLSGTVPGQLDAVTSRTDLVTVGIGGNDFGLFSALVACAGVGGQDPDGTPCQDRLGRQRVAELTRDAGRVEQRVAAALDEIGRRAPDATVVVVGYPQVVPADRTCPERLPVAAGDHAFVAGLNQRLAESVRRAAEGAGARYVDVYAASEGHDLCSADPWINTDESVTGRALAYHPLAPQQEAVAELVLTALA